MLGTRWNWPAALVVLGGIALVAARQPSPAAEETLCCANLEEWMPGDVLAFARVNDLGAHIGRYLDSDLRRKVEATTAYRTFQGDKQYEDLKNLLAWIETTTGHQWRAIVETLAGREIALGARPRFGMPSLTVLSRAASAATLGEMLAAIEKGLAAQGTWPFSEPEPYEGVAIRGSPYLHFAALGDVLALATTLPDLHAVIDLARGRATHSVRTAPALAEAVRGFRRENLLDAVAGDVGGFTQGIPDKADNFASSLLAGHWLVALRHGRTFRLSLSAGAPGLDLALSATAPDLGRRLASYFPPVPPADLLGRLEKRELLSAFQMHRDFAQWWTEGESMVMGAGVGEMLQFAQFMSLVFGGRSFQDEILKELLPTVTLVTRNEEYRDLGAKPQPAIPGFAMVLEMRDPSRFGRLFQAALQSTVAFINLDLAQKGKGDHMMLMEPERLGEVTIHTTNRCDPLAKVDNPGIEYNFSPSMALVGKYIVLSSTKDLARIIVEEMATLPEDAAGLAAVPEDLTIVDGGALHDILRDNRRAIVANTMMTKGVGLEEAEAELDTGLDLLALAERLEVVTRLDGDTMTVRMKLAVRAAKREGAGRAGL